MYQDQFLLRVDINEINSYVESYVDKKFDHNKTLLNKQNKKIMKTLKEKYNADQKVGDITDNPNENDTKNEKDDTELGNDKLIVYDDMKTPAPRIRKPTKIFMSPYLTEFDFSSKGKESATVDFPQKHHFDDFSISEDGPTRSIMIYFE
ncbi:hypothetical protein FXO37_17937 [Capsicum annuum]|nr:hypothetical protein FXO37_17937 [Capsicum annuum]